MNILFERNIIKWLFASGIVTPTEHLSGVLVWQQPTSIKQATCRALCHKLMIRGSRDGF